MNENLINNPTPSDTAPKSKVNLLAVVAVLIGIVAMITTVISSMMLNQKITRSETTTRLLIEHLQTETLAEFNRDHALMQTLTSSHTITRTNLSHLNDMIAQVQLANDALHHENNIAFAISLLTAVETQMNMDPTLHNQTISTLLSQTLTTLKNLPALNTSALYLKISQLITTMDTLPLCPTPTHISPKEIPAETSVPDKTWREHLSDSWQSLKKLVNVRHDDEVLTPALLDEEDRAFIHARAIALLTQTQLALLQRQDAIYHNSLKMMIDWLSSYFAMDDARVKAVNAELTSLNQENLLPPLPSLTPLLDALLNLQKNKMAPA